MNVLFICVIAWLISPIPLLILWLVTRKRAKKQEKLLRQLIRQQRIEPIELKQAGLYKLIPPQNPQTFNIVPPQTQQPAAAPPLPVSADIKNTSPQIPPCELPAADDTAIAAETEIPTVATSAAVAADIPTDVTAAPIPAADTAEPLTPPVLPEQSAPAAEEKSLDHTIAQPTDTIKEQFVSPSAFTPPAEYKQPNVPAVPQPQRTNRISAITVMLSVGVLLVIIAGLIFVRTAWEKLSDIGRLATLAAGSILFFGTSALAHRIWKLKRTGMAFFTLGTAFLPISVWAAGYLNLLGDGLSGAGNPWLIALAFVSFTVISLIAVLLYRQKGWGVAFLCGLSVTYCFIAAALSGQSDTASVPFMIAVSLYGLILAFTARLIAPHIPQEIGSALEPVTILVNILTAFSALVFAFAAVFDADTSYHWLNAVPAFLCAFAFFSPVFTERMKNLTALPVSLLTVPAMSALLIPFGRSLFIQIFEDYDVYAECAYIALILMLCAAIWMLLLLTNSLPDETRTGFLRASAILTVLSVPLLLIDMDDLSLVNFTILACAIVILTVGWMLTVRKNDSAPLRVLIGVQVWTLCALGSNLIHEQILQLPEQAAEYKSLMAAGCFLLGFVILLLLKKYRTGISDLLLTVFAFFPLISRISENWNRIPSLTAIGTALGLVLLYWVLAFEHDTHKPHQNVFAVLSPIALAVTAIAAANGIPPTLPSIFVPLFWSLTAFALGFAAYFTTKRKFHSARKLMFNLMIIPPILFAALCDVFVQDNRRILLPLISTAVTAGLWLLFSNRGFRFLSITAFCASLFLLTETTAFGIRNLAGSSHIDFTILMIASVWILLFSLLAIAISRRMVVFVGSKAISGSMQMIAPLSVLILSLILLNMSAENWESFYFVYVFGMSVLAWFTTSKSSISLPAACALALIFSIEALRNQAMGLSNTAVVLILLLFTGMTALFPYLGIVSREADDEPIMQRRSWLLTVLGGIVPFWLLIAAENGTKTQYYSDAQTEWMIFFVPVLLAGYLLHFLFVTKNEQYRRRLILSASALGVIAFWMQPLVDVQDTWFAGKLHIIPLIAFGFVLRSIYGKKQGGTFLFIVGIYTMLRLAATAIATEAAVDLLTLLTVGFIIFLISFFIKQKKWFLLGGLSLVMTAVYLHMKLTDGRQWWIYLLLAGLILIVVAASNELLKQRGDSLKSKTGRLLEDWKW